VSPLSTHRRRDEYREKNRKNKKNNNYLSLSIYLFLRVFRPDFVVFVAGREAASKCQ